MFRYSRLLTQSFLVFLAFAVMPGAQRPSAAQPLNSATLAIPKTRAFPANEVGSPRAADQKPVLYVIGTSHLDSQWNWTVQDSIRQFVPNTFFENFQRFEKYPDYKFNYEGAIHYMWFKEYHPEMWPAVQKYVADGRWRLAGSWINAVDVNVPSPESLMRQALYGKWFQRHEFGKVSQDVYLPDCFGFGFALPSIASHCGLKAFTTQKLTWGSSYGIPFPIGRWKGVDGNTVVAALNPGDYVTRVRSDVSVDPKWSNDLTTLSTGRKVGLRLFGVGDIGGAPDDESVTWIEKALANKNGTVEVRNTSNDQLSKDLSDAEKASLPEYEGELTMKTHGVGCYTSQAAMKRFNRENEKLAQSAEQAAVAADLLSVLPYPRERLREAWIRVLWHQFHDDLTGTCIPMAYQFSWNDELVSLNQYAGVLTSATSAVATRMDTRSNGIPLVVYNPLSISRRDVIEANMKLGASMPEAFHIVDQVTGQEVPVQILDRNDGNAHILFLADMPSLGYKIFDVVTGKSQLPISTGLKVSGSLTDSLLENARYRVKIDVNGDISSVLDKEAGRELLKSPVRLEMRNDPSPDKPAWRILWDTVNSPVREYLAEPEIRVVENGPVRVTLEITRHAADSSIVERVSLTEGGDRVDVENLIDWKSPNTLLKAAFNLASSNPKATYDLGLGTIQRGNNTPDHYEVPGQRWADMTDTTGSFGAAVLNNSKYGWDKPADDVLRLTLLHTPRPGAWPRPFYQAGQDLGHHRFTYSIAGHRGDWRAGAVPNRAAALNHPLIAFQTTPHAGPLGREFSMLSISSDGGAVKVAALKKAEDSDEVVVRLEEQYGRPAKADVKLAGRITAAHEINGAEEVVGPIVIVNGRLHLNFKAYQPRTFAVKLAPRRDTAPILSKPLDLPFNLDGISTNTNRKDGDFDGKGQTLAAELVPSQLQLNGVDFRFGPTTSAARNVLVPHGQSVTIPAGTYNKLYVIAAAVGGDVQTSFGGMAGTIREWQGPVGQWYSQLKSPHMLQESFIPELKGQTWTEQAIRAEMVTQFDPVTGALNGIDQIRPAFLKRDEIAWVGTHRHSPSGDQFYVPSYLFGYVIDLPQGAREITLPDDSRLRILAISAFRDRYAAWPTLPLYANDLPEPSSQTGL